MSWREVARKQLGRETGGVAVQMTLALFDQFTSDLVTNPFMASSLACLSLSPNNDTFYVTAPRIPILIVLSYSIDSEHVDKKNTSRRIH